MENSWRYIMNYKNFIFTLTGCLLSLSLNASQASSTSMSSTSSARSASSPSTSSSSSATLRQRHHPMLQTNLSPVGSVNLNADQLQRIILRSCDGALAPIFLGSAGIVCTTTGAFIMASHPAGSVLLLSLGAGYFAIAGFLGNNNASNTRTSKHSKKSE